MASCESKIEIIVCETLCFIRQHCHYDRLQISELKEVICSLYNEDELLGAKDLLSKVIGQVPRAVCSA